MKCSWLCLGLALILSACGSDKQLPAVAQEPDEVADVIYTNGKIYTVDDSLPWAEAVAIKDGRFIAVGSSGDAAAVAGDSTEVIDLDGAFAMPGIQENHLHPGSGGVTIGKYTRRVLFTPEESPDEIRQILRNTPTPTLETAGSEVSSGAPNTSTVAALEKTSSTIFFRTGQ